MSCNIQKKTLDYLKKKGLIEENRKIPTEKLEDFNTENKSLTKYAKDSKGVDMGPLFTVENNIKEREGKTSTQFINRAVPNIEAFNAIQKYNDDELENTKTFELKLKELQDSKPEIKSFVYNSKKTSKRNVNKSTEELFEDTTSITDILFGGTQTNLTANEFLRNGLSHPELEINDAGKAIMRAMLPTRAKIKFVSKQALKNGENTYAQYNIDNRTIEINRDVLNTGNVYYALESILHEITHDMTARSFIAPKNDIQRAFRDNISKAYQYYNSNTEGNYYGLENELEFISEIMTNSEFRKELKSIDKGNLFTRIINFIKSLFGSDVVNMAEVTKSIVEIFEQESNNYNSPIQKGYTLEKNTSEESKKKTASSKLNAKLTDVKGVINKILSSIEAVKRKSISSKGYNKKNQEKFDKISKLLDKLAKTEPKKAVLEYLTIAEKEIEGLMYSLDQSAEEGKLTTDYINRSRQYATVFNYVDDITNIVTRLKSNKEITRDEYNTITDSLDVVTAKYKRYRKESLNLSKDILADKFANYNTIPITQAKDKYAKEYRKLKPVGKTKEQYIQEKLDENQEEIAQQQYDQVREQMDIIPSDISGYNAMLETEKNIPSLVIHLASLSFDKADAEIRSYGISLRNSLVDASKKYNAKGSTNKSKYGKLLDNGYLISEYKAKFLSEYNKYKSDILSKEEEFGTGSKEHKAAKSKFTKWRKENTIKKYKEIEGIKVLESELPIDKWKNPNYNKLNKEDLEFLNRIKTSAINADEMTNNINTLISKPLAGKTSVNAFTMIKLPSIRRTDVDMLLSGNLGQVIKDKAGDLVKKRADDTEFGEITDQNLENSIKVMATMDGQTKNVIPVHYRAPIDAKDQSLDLPTIFLLNESMAKNFEVKSKLEADIVMLKEVVADTSVQQVETVSGLRKLSAYLGFNKKEHSQIASSGLESNIYKKLSSMIENRLYSISEVSAGKILGMDINALTSGISSFSADLTLGLNYLSAMPNMLQAKIQNKIEAVGINTFTSKDLRFAEKEYWSQMMKGGLNDIGALKNSNKINMLIEKFDIMGDFNVVKNLIEDDTKLRALMKKGTLHSMNSMAEHYAQATLMLAIMNNTKIKNKKGQYINTKGDVVTKNEAMTLYEAFSIKDGNLVFNDKANSSSFTNSDFSELGMIQHQNLIKKKIIDLHGQYDNKLQSHIQRFWYGKLFFMFRKWMLSSYKRRYRGMAHAGKSWDSLTEEQKQYDHSLQEYEEGTYTSFARFMITGVFASIKNLELEIATTNWENLSDKERANIYKVARELTITSLMAIATVLMVGLAEDDEESEMFYYTLAYVFRRQQSELMQYYHPGENLRVFRTPFAALTTIEKAKNAFTQLMPWAITERYENGNNKGELKSWIKFKKIIPYVAQTERSAEQSLKFLQNVTQ